jgi:hypothetical protein
MQALIADRGVTPPKLDPVIVVPCQQAIDEGLIGEILGRVHDCVCSFA